MKANRILVLEKTLKKIQYNNALNPYHSHIKHLTGVTLTFIILLHNDLYRMNNRGEMNFTET